jgi:hypothetical protein
MFHLNTSVFRFIIGVVESVSLATYKLIHKFVSDKLG